MSESDYIPQSGITKDFDPILSDKGNTHETAEIFDVSSVIMDQNIGLSKMSNFQDLGDDYDVPVISDDKELISNKSDTEKEESGVSGSSEFTEIASEEVLSSAGNVSVPLSEQDIIVSDDPISTDVSSFDDGSHPVLDKDSPTYNPNFPETSNLIFDNNDGIQDILNLQMQENTFRESEPTHPYVSNIQEVSSLPEEIESSKINEENLIKPTAEFEELRPEQLEEKSIPYLPDSCFTQLPQHPDLPANEPTSFLGDSSLLVSDSKSEQEYNLDMENIDIISTKNEDIVQSYASPTEATFLSSDDMAKFEAQYSSDSINEPINVEQSVLLDPKLEPHESEIAEEQYLPKEEIMKDTPHEEEVYRRESDDFSSNQFIPNYPCDNTGNNKNFSDDLVSLEKEVSPLREDSFQTHRDLNLIGSNSNPMELDQAYLNRNLSPIEREPSPIERELSPIEREPSPILREPSPIEREPSPYEREPSPILRDPSPIERDPSPIERESSPFERDLSPIRRDPSPIERDPSPIERKSSPFEHDLSPIEKNIPPVQECNELSYIQQDLQLSKQNENIQETTFSTIHEPSYDPLDENITPPNDEDEEEEPFEILKATDIITEGQNFANLSSELRENYEYREEVIDVVQVGVIDSTTTSKSTKAPIFDLEPLVNLIYWRDVKKSGAVFGVVMLILLSLAYFSFISVVAYASLTVLTGTIAFRLYKSIMQAIQKSQDGHPFKKFLDMDTNIPQEKMHEMTDVAVTQLNSAVTELKRLFFVEDLIDSVKFGCLLWILTYLGSWFNGLTLVILGVVALFSLPKVYEQNQAQIDQYLGLVRTHVNDVMTKVRAAIPIGNKEKAQ